MTKDRSPIIALSFCAPHPHPHPACVGLTPDEEYEQAEAARECALSDKAEHTQAVVAEREQAAAETDKKGIMKVGSSVLCKLSNIVTEAGAAIGKSASDATASVEAKLRASHKKKNQEKFAHHFPALAAAGEQVIATYECSAMHDSALAAGDLHVTTDHVCFCGAQVAEAIAYKEVSSVQRSVALATASHGPPHIQLSPAADVVYNTLQIFTTRLRVYQFVFAEATVIGTVGKALTHTVHGREIERCFSFLDHAWRAAVQVPLENVQYA